MGAINRLTRWESNHTLLHRGTQLDIVASWRSITNRIIQTQEEHGVPPNKHYEIPFERGYTVLFPLSYSVKPPQAT